MAKQDFKQMSQEILANIGGKENLTSVNHCATRLRLGLKDTSKVNKAKLQKIDGVLGVEVMDTQMQVIVGQTIEDLYFAFEKETGMSGAVAEEGKEKKKRTVLSVFVDFLQMMAKIMSPVIPALICAGFFSLILTIATMFFGVQTTDSTYIILHSLGQAAFYFLPLMVAYTSAKNFDVEVPLALLLAGFLLYPDWIALVNAGSATGFTSYFGIPVLLQTYNGSVLQIILSVWVMSKIGKWLNKVLPNAVRYFLKPVILMFVMSIITLSVTGPLGGLLTGYVGAFIGWVRSTVPWLTVPAIYLFSATLGVFMPGFHLALIPIATQNFAALGYDDIINIWFFSGTTVPGFVALWTALKTKSVKGRNVAYPAAISALFGGISEPTTYGILYKIPQLYAVNMVTGFVLALYNGIVGTKAYAYGAYYLTNILLFYSPNDPGNLTKALIGVAIAGVVSFLGVNLTKWTWPEDDSDVEEGENVAPKLSNTKLLAPVAGQFVAQKSISDKAFADGTLGTCFAVKPSSDNIIAPVSGTINSVAETSHAVTIKGNDGSEVMVHMSLDSMKVEPGDIDVKVKVGDTVKAGDPIAVLHRDKLAAKSIDDTVIVVLLNSAKYSSVSVEDNAIIAKA